ncbi:MAG: hypothetical protein ACI92O_001921 [Colwellia sp.]
MTSDKDKDKDKTLVEIDLLELKRDIFATYGNNIALYFMH